MVTARALYGIMRVHSGVPKVIKLIDETELRESENTEVCADCFGTGTKVDPVKGAMPCPCRKSESFRKLLSAARIPRRYEKCSFGNFISSPSTSQGDAVYHAHKFADQYPAVSRGLLFMGAA